MTSHHHWLHCWKRNNKSFPNQSSTNEWRGIVHGNWKTWTDRMSCLHKTQIFPNPPSQRNWAFFATIFRLGLNFHLSSTLLEQYVRNFNPKFQPVRNKTNRENTHVKENNHKHKTIFTWFGNLPTSTELQGFHYY